MTGRTRMRTLGGVLVGGRRRALPPGGATDDAGMVLVETALAMPLLTVVAVLLAWALNVGATSLALGDAARSAAREIARGEAVSEALARAASTIPGANTSVESGDDSVVVVVSKDVRSPMPVLSGLPVTVTQRVAVPKEWS